jgi:Cysteine-rich CWC
LAGVRSSFDPTDDKMMNLPTETGARDAPDAQFCERCGAAFRCGMRAGDSSCWCATLPALPVDKLRPGMNCLCPACLAAEIERAARAV